MPTIQGKSAMFQGFYQLRVWRRVLALLALLIAPLVGAALASGHWIPGHPAMAMLLGAMGALLFALVLSWPELAQLTEHAFLSMRESAKVTGGLDERVSTNMGVTTPVCGQGADPSNARIIMVREIAAADPQRAAQLLKRWIMTDG